MHFYCVLIVSETLCIVSRWWQFSIPLVPSLRNDKTSQKYSFEVTYKTSKYLMIFEINSYRRTKSPQILKDLENIQWIFELACTLFDPW